MYVICKILICLNNISKDIMFTIEILTDISFSVYYGFASKLNNLDQLQNMARNQQRLNTKAEKKTYICLGAVSIL